MSRHKSSRLKNQLQAEAKSSRSVPTWVVLRTKRKVRTSPARRNWRRRKLKIA
ncbi:MAG: 50S ribosomal protein L39e [Thaumarchaeota archaeon]|nr:50S ribosomal protein L39e [Nitrososphaerota archaeon]